MAANPNQCKKWLFVLTGAALFFSAGYLTSEYGLLAPQFWNYNAKHIVTEALAIQASPKESLVAGVWFASLEENGTVRYALENITLNSANFSNVGGAYIGGNVLWMKDIRDEHVFAHELCHLILSRYGVNDALANENICYTVGSNYRAFPRVS